MITYKYHSPSFCLKTVSITTTGRSVFRVNIVKELGLQDSDFIDWDVFEDGNEKYAKTKKVK
jgi:hypothetical protein